MTNSRLLIALILLSLLSMILSVYVGSVYLDAQEIINALTLQNASPITQQIIFELRLPRMGCAFVTGGLLALAGALMQVLLRNPLADPYILGVSGGAAVGNISALLIGLSGYWLPISGFAGALFSMLLVFVLGKPHHHSSTTRLLLTGIVIASGWGALISFILIVSPSETLKSLLFWLMGNLNETSFSPLALGVLMLGMIISIGLAPRLNILLQGELRAKALGVNTQSLQLQLYLLSGLLTATAVALAGSISFVGLIVPHILRLIIRSSDHRILLPASVLFGGSLLTLADILARTLLAPQQLPVGIITVLIGVPTFLYLYSLERN